MGIEKYNLDSEVYQNLTENLEAKNASNNKKWTFYLVFCSFIVCLSSFQFGYNVGSVNSITPVSSISTLNNLGICFIYVVVKPGIWFLA